MKKDDACGRWRATNHGVVYYIGLVARVSLVDNRGVIISLEYFAWHRIGIAHVCGKDLTTVDGHAVRVLQMNSNSSRLYFIGYRHFSLSAFACFCSSQTLHNIYSCTDLLHICHLILII